MRPLSLTLLLLASCAAPPNARVARESSVQGPVAQPERPWAVALDGKDFERADLDESDGEVKVSRYGVRLERKWLLSRASGWKLRLGHEESEYDFSRGGGLGPLDDFERAAETSVGATWWKGSQDGPSWFALGNLVAAHADGADLGDGVYVKLFGGAQWRVSEDLSLGFGLFARSELEDDPRFFPIPLIDWRIDEKNHLGVVQSVDPGLGYTRTVDEQVDFYVSLLFTTRQFRLDDGDVDDAAVLDSEKGLRFGVLYDDGEALKAEVFTGLATRELELSADDEELGDDEVDPALFVGFAVTFAF